MRRGAALLVALIVVALVTAMAAVVTVAALGAGKAGRLTRAREAALVRAESGVELALARLERDPRWPGANGAAVPGGSCDVEVEGLKDGSFRIRSRALWKRQAVVVDVTVRPAGAGRFRVVAWRRTTG